MIKVDKNFFGTDMMNEKTIIRKCSHNYESQ